MKHGTVAVSGSGEGKKNIVICNGKKFSSIYKIRNELNFQVSTFYSHPKQPVSSFSFAAFFLFHTSTMNV